MNTLSSLLCSFIHFSTSFVNSVDSSAVLRQIQGLIEDIHKLHWCWKYVSNTQSKWTTEPYGCWNIIHHLFSLVTWMLCWKCQPKRPRRPRKISLKGMKRSERGKRTVLHTFTESLNRYLQLKELVSRQWVSNSSVNYIFASITAGLRHSSSG